MCIVQHRISKIAVQYKHTRCGHLYACMVQNITRRPQYTKPGVKNGYVSAGCLIAYHYAVLDLSWNVILPTL